MSRRAGKLSPSVPSAAPELQSTHNLTSSSEWGWFLQSLACGRHCTDPVQNGERKRAWSLPSGKVVAMRKATGKDSSEPHLFFFLRVR